MIEITFVNFEEGTIKFDISPYYGFGDGIIYDSDEVPEDFEGNSRRLKNGISDEIVADLDKIAEELVVIPLSCFAQTNVKSHSEPAMWVETEKWFPLDAGIKTLTELLLYLQKPRKQSARKKRNDRLCAAHEVGKEIIEELEYLKRVLERVSQESPEMRFTLNIH